MSTRSRHWLTAVLVGALAGCGGGGGTAESGAAPSPVSAGTTGSTTATPVSATGLVPVAPAAGATLFADASVLRPVQDGSVWQYRGTAVAGPGVSPISYVTTTRQSSTRAGEATETTTNSANGGADSATLSITAGVVNSSQPIDFTGKGAPGLLQLVELRSPVRLGDQITSLDRHYTDTTIDADGDGKPDAVDVAVYSTVAATEAVVLPNLPTVQAVRVDTVVLTRVTYSSNGKLSPVIQATQQVWYAPGIGIVRQSTAQPTASNNGVATTDESIVAFDGVSSGFGAMDTLLPTIPSTSGVYPGQTLPAQSIPNVSAYAFGDHALVVTTTPDVFTGTLVSSVDLRGRVTATRLLQSVYYSFVRALRDGLVLIDANPTSGVDYSVVQLDANGAVVGPANGAPIRLSGTHVSSQVTRLSVAADDSTLWFFWTRSFYDPGDGRVPGNELVLRPFSPAGVALGPEQIVDSGNVQDPAISAAGGKVLLTWSRAQPGLPAVPPYDVFYRSASLAGLGSTQAFAQRLPASPFLTPLQLGADSAIVWRSAIDGHDALSATGGIRYDSQLQPLRAGPDFADEQVPGLPPFDAVAAAPLTGSSRLLSVATEPKSPPSNSGDNLIQSLGWIDMAGTTPLAKLPVHTVRFEVVQPTAVVGFADRAIVFGRDVGSRLTTTVVWLNNGSAPR